MKQLTLALALLTVSSFAVADTYVIQLQKCESKQAPLCATILGNETTGAPASNEEVVVSVSPRAPQGVKGMIKSITGLMDVGVNPGSLRVDGKLMKKNQRLIINQIIGQ